MQTLVVATAMVLTAAFVFAPGQKAQAQGYSKEQTTTHKAKKKKTTAKRVVRSASPYSTNPEYDVYVNGVYVGSDPDPRIRWSLKREYCSESLDGCGY